MTFICDQEWDSMKRTEKGRFCSMCKHEVFDFSRMTIAEINAMKGEKGQLCGNFRIDQVEQDLRPIEFSAIKKSRYWFATVGTLLGLELAQVKAQNKNETKTEIHIDSSMKDNPSDPANDTLVDCTNTKSNEFDGQKPFMAFASHYYYWTKKFPFITKRRKHYLRGKF